MDLSLTPLDPVADVALLHSWLAAPRARFWGMTDHSPAQVRGHLEAVCASPYEDGWIGRRNGEALVYVETYDPARLLPTGLLEPAPGDLGMHLLIAPARGESEHGLTASVMAQVMRWCLDERGAARVVVEPDERNTAVLAKNAAAGFQVLEHVEIPDGVGTKRAALSVCTRDDFAASVLGDGRHGMAHLNPQVGEEVNRRLLGKAIGELAHERMLAPARIGPSQTPGADGTFRAHRYALDVPGTRSRYEFDARVLPLEHWMVDPTSIRRLECGRPARLDVQLLVAELQEQLGLSDQLASTYLEELAATFAARCETLDQAHRGRRPAVDQLLEADQPTIEAAMTEGHPGFLAANGRIGFSLTDHRAYAPEQGQRTRLQWVAARRELSHLSLGAGLDEAAHTRWSLSGEERDAFATRLEGRGLDPADFHLLPLHPWQAEHRLALTFAPDVSRGALVPLGRAAMRCSPSSRCAPSGT